MSGTHRRRTGDAISAAHLQSLLLRSTSGTPRQTRLRWRVIRNLLDMLRALAPANPPTGRHHTRPLPQIRPRHQPPTGQRREAA